MKILQAAGLEYGEWKLQYTELKCVDTNSNGELE
jgi:hypothetical protein